MSLVQPNISAIPWMMHTVRDLLGFVVVNTLSPKQNGRHFVDDTFKCIFLNKNVRILIKISLKFVPKGPINNIPALVKIMADQVRSRPHISVARPQWAQEFYLKLSWILHCHWDNYTMHLALVMRQLTIRPNGTWAAWSHQSITWTSVD